MDDAPQISSNTVFFIGNGVMRLPSRIVLPDITDDSKLSVKPSWAAYLDSLWNLVDESRITIEAKQAILSRHDFSKLSAPRQAEWFDRWYAIPVGNELAIRRSDLSALRLHELGRTLHESPGLLTNPVLEVL